MNFDHLRYFVTTAEVLHTSKASEILGISQSTVVHGIRKLEEEFDQKFFKKIGKNIFLTDRGKLFLAKAKDVLFECNQLKDEILADDGQLEGKYRAGATHGISDGLISVHLAKLQKNHANLVFEMFSLRSSQVLEGVVKQQLDFGVCLSPNPHPQVEVLDEKSVKLKIAVRPGHPILGTQLKRRVELLQKCPMASPKAFVGIEVCEDHPSLITQGLVDKPHFIFDSYSVAASYIEASNAWSLIPETFLKRYGLREVQLPNFRAETRIAVIKSKHVILPKRLCKFLQSLAF